MSFLGMNAWQLRQYGAPIAAEGGPRLPRTAPARSWPLRGIFSPRCRPPHARFVQYHPQGELAVLTCRSDYAYGARGSPPKIPGGAVLTFEVTLTP